VARTSGKQPAELGFEDLDAGTIGGFLASLEKERGVSVATRNARLVALRSWFAFAAHRHPEHAALIARVLAIPSKRRDRPLVSFLEPDEADALLKAPGTGRWTGRRDRALLAFAVQTGLRASELTAVRNADIALGRGAHVQASRACDYAEHPGPGICASPATASNPPTPGGAVPHNPRFRILGLMKNSL
jgi:integrase/recombinase XerD